VPGALVPYAGSSPTVVIRQIDTSEAPKAAQQPVGHKAVTPATTAGKTFAAHLASQKKATDSPAAKVHRDPIDAPDGEVWRPVKGDDNYAKITSGPREGEYINLSRGARRGQTFHVEMRDGKRVHVYGKGDNETVVAAAKDSGKVNAKGHPHTSAASHTRNETWAPVDGVSNYADILSGPRNGYFVNTSGGSRDGMTFQIVNRGGKTYHVYGEGKHRQMVEVRHHEKSTHTSSGASVKDSETKAAAASATGGTAPADG
jgi:hypothetical protein